MAGAGDDVAVRIAEALGGAADRVDVPRLLQGAERLPPAVLGGTRGALADSLSVVFLATGALALAGVALAIALEERPLRA